MRWWRQLQERLQWFDDAEWPNGVAWPEGRPSQMRRFARTRAVCTVTPILVGGILIATGLPFAVVLVAFMLLGVLPTAGFMLWSSVREAKRQGWGSNLR